ncbi:Protein TraJ [Frankliniella fusca]|uniref:Protein TraJ n=1 Tax=Frankliniella fusca TaxID=407009 RepID=A0AAE1LEB6_9NEOP|nr:Protein TraJ [Frankliniella fusca]
MCRFGFQKDFPCNASLQKNDSGEWVFEPERNSLVSKYRYCSCDIYKRLKAIHKLYMKSCAERDIGAQEVCHGLLGLPFCSAGGRKFVYLNLSEKKWIQISESLRSDDTENDQTIHGKSAV